MTQSRERRNRNKARRRNTDSAVIGISLTPYQRFTAEQIRGYRTYKSAIGELYYVFKIGDSPIASNPEKPGLFVTKDQLRENFQFAAEFEDPIDGETRYLTTDNQIDLGEAEEDNEPTKEEERKQDRPDFIRDAKPKTRNYKFSSSSQTIEYIEGKPKKVNLLSIRADQFVVLDIDEKLPPGLRIKGAIAKVKTSRGTQYIIPRSEYVDQGLGSGLYEQISTDRGSYDIRTREKRYVDMEGKALPWRNNARTIQPLGKGKKGGELRKLFSLIGNTFVKAGGKKKE
jgi:hypothetical protein